MEEKRKAYVAAILYACIIGFSFMFVKFTLTVASPMETLAHRFTVAFIGALILLRVKKIQLNITWKDALQILPMALLYPIAFFAFQISGLARISSSEAGIIQAAIPIFTLVLASVILKEKATRGQLVFISLSVFGVIYLFIMSGAGAEIANLIGSVFILTSALASALYNVFVRKLTQQYSVIIITFMMTFIGFVVFNSMAIGQHVMSGTLIEYFQPFMHMKFVLSILYLGVLSSLVTLFLSNYALSKIEAAKMSVFNNFSTLITILVGVMFLKEDFYLYHLIGAIFIIVGIVGTNYFGTKEKSSEKV
ncbi:DMT family transporter [Lysinibacillus sp. NPDC097287]|uniref:DMT family transporter n=1 Tax=Lysinibacillus sp. NPDC097287 TaxID=3364144 RepID=UPI00381E7B83